ncbi:MAG: hypothetical protein U1E53_29090 [Dongiaceae bacterium]
MLASEIGLPATPDGIAREIASGRARPMPVARANGRCFAVMAGAGFDAHVVAASSIRARRSACWERVPMSWRACASSSASASRATA